jgi:CubicO group peptidase (beta-lactamase class C family)
MDVQAQASDTTCTYHFPPPGQGLGNQDIRRPEEVGLDPGVVRRIDRWLKAHRDERKTRDQRWALWRHGYLVHVEGEFDEPVEVASLRKTWHAMIVGAALKQGRIPSLDQKLSTWQGELAGPHAEATWRHVLTQSAGFDYPHGEHPAYAPGEMWTYSDWNLFHLCHALAKVYGKAGFYDHYEDVAAAAYLHAIGMRGWSTEIVFDRSSQMDDGVRLVLSLEHMGRLGLLVVARGTWSGVELVPRWFVEQLESKQTRGMRVNYAGPYDGVVGLDPAQFPEAPYGYLTWVNTDGDLCPGADRAWAWGSGAGGMKVIWNHKLGIVFAGIGVRIQPGEVSVPQFVEAAILGRNPLF